MVGPVSQRNPYQPQKGFALLTVLLVVALVSMVTTELMYNQQVQIKRSGFMIHQSHSLSVAYGFESWVKKGLAADLQANQTDHLKEQWAQALPPIDFEGGLVSGQLIDLHSRLNLNNVLEQDETKRQFWQKAVDRLVNLSLQSDQVARDFTGFSDVLTDWVDVNDEVSDYGAESATYLLKQPAYRAANQPLVMVSELQNLQMMEELGDAELQKLKEQVATLPVVTAININTVDALVLQSLTDWMTAEIVQQWSELRNESPAENTGTFVDFLVQVTGYTQTEIEDDLPADVITVKSDYFQLQALIEYGEVKQGVFAIFHRESDNKVRLVQRWLNVS